MNTTTEEKKNLSTADFAAAGEHREAPPQQRSDMREPEMREPAERREIHEPDREAAMHEQREPGASMPVKGQDEQLAPLFLPMIAQQFRSRWDEIQIGFVDDPTEAVRKADELVAQVMKSLAESFADQREHVEEQMDQNDTEHLRVALRRYRSFFQRLLSL
jgi:hypothetical protein